MIGYVKGKIIFKDEDTITVDTGGVGYRIFVSDKLLSEVKEGQEVELYTWTHLRQNALDLYGCSSQEELEFFSFLEVMSGIGPKIALSLIRYGSPERLKDEIESKGSRFIKEVKGVGQKKLKQLLLELTGKVEELKAGLNKEQEEAIEALKGLGFSVRESKEVVANIREDGAEKIVEKALSQM